MAWAAGLACALALDDPRRRFPAYALAMVVASVAAMVASRADRRASWVLLGAAICARLWALTLPPAFSEDVFRYVYEGRVALVHGPLFAFAHPPADGPALGIAPELLDASWLRINHASIPTLYPPLAQATFIAAAALGELFGGGHVVLLKLLLVLAELLCVARVLRWHRASGLAMLLCPLSIVEIAREGHGDALALMGLGIGALALARGGRVREAAVGFALATLGKLVGIVPLLTALRADVRRAAWPALAMVALAFVPYAIGSSAGLETYGRAWRSGDGAFSVLLTLAEALLGGDWNRIGDTTVTAHGLARALTALAFAACAAWVFLRRRALAPLDQAGLLVLLVLLWSPTVHPWYVLWLVPFAAISTSWSTPMRALIVLAPLLHHPGWLALDSGLWTDVPGLRALVHVPVWVLLVYRSRVV